MLLVMGRCLDFCPTQMATLHWAGIERSLIRSLAAAGLKLKLLDLQSVQQGGDCFHKHINRPFPQSMWHQWTIGSFDKKKIKKNQT